MSWALAMTMAWLVLAGFALAGGGHVIAAVCVTNASVWGAAHYVTKRLRAECAG